MKGSMRKAGCLLAGLLAIVVLSGCPPVPTTVVTVSPDSADVEVGQTITLEADSTDVADTTFEWTSSDEDVAVVEDAKTSGTSVTVRGVSAGTATVTATGSSSGVVGSALITVPEEEVVPGEIQPALLAAGLNVTITGVVIPADRKPEVSFTAKNTKNQTIAKSELSTIRVILDYLQPAAVGGTPKFASYTTSATNGQAGYDSAQMNGLTQLADGTFKYKFAKAIPADYSASAAHQVGMQIARLYAIDGLTYPANPVYLFRPDGGKTVTGRDVVSTATCVKCHTRLEFHGGQRREVQLCILCHQPQTVDPESGNSVNMTEMIHKIHMGEQLPSVEGGTPYQIVGHNNTVYDYSEIVFPQAITNCTTCHESTKATQANVYLTNPTIEACGSCHDRTWFGTPTSTPAGYTNHPFDFEQTDSSQCALCHTATETGVAPISIAHATETEPGMSMEILSLTPNAETGVLQMQFKLTYGDGTPITDVTTPDRVGVVVGWPASDYQNNISETMGGKRAITGTLESTTSDTGIYNYTFLATLPLGSTDTFGAALTGRIKSVPDGEGVQINQGTLSNALTFFTVDGSEPVARRLVVEQERCNACHKDLRFHGESRLGVDLCVMCHRPNGSNDGVTINFKQMIHYIHTGAELENGYELGDFSGVHFPGKRQQCTMCHISGTFGVPLPEEAQPTVIGEEMTPAARAACTSCHDSTAADTHAYLASNAEGVESCAVCHGASADFAVSLVHKLNP